MRNGAFAATVIALGLALASCGTSPHPASLPSSSSSTAPASTTTSSTRGSFSATTTPSTIATTSTTGASVLPGAPPCEQDIAGANVPSIRPGLIFVGCATSNEYLNSITWTSWAGMGATGSGTDNVNNCEPNCASGTYTRFPVMVSLTDPTNLGGLIVFTTISMIPTTSIGQPKTVTADHLYGAWGWVPQRS